MQLDTEPRTVDDSSLERHPSQYRAPREHGSLLAVPPLDRAAALIATNRRRRQTYNSPIADQTVGQLAKQARSELLQAALEHTSSYRDLDNATIAPDQPIIMSGHQPRLFHSGVWVKNFALDRIARETGANAIQLLVDNDVVGAVEIQVPQEKPAADPIAGEPTAVLRRIALDDPTSPVPYEERYVGNAARFDRAGAEIAAAVAALVEDPTVTALWPLAVAARQRQSKWDGTANLGMVIAEARHQLERQWGLETLEVPLSRICQGVAFRLFTAHLCEGLDEFQVIYNRALIDYRRRNRLRSNSHPAPTLTQQGEFLEAPFWIWTSDQPTRQPLFVARDHEAFVLRAGSDGQPWNLDCHGDPVNKLAIGLSQLESEHGIKIRPRAMITTLFARLFLCDLFLHGIGGGKYDQVTDQLAMDFFGCQPPEFMVLSATMHLPCARVPVELDDIRQIDGLLRALWFHPEQHAEQVSPENSLRFAELALDKRSLLAQKPGPGKAKAWHARLEDTNKKLRIFLAENREALIRERHRLAQRRLADKIFSSREYSFSLFSANTLRSSLRRQVQ